MASERRITRGYAASTADLIDPGEQPERRGQMPASDPGPTDSDTARQEEGPPNPSSNKNESRKASSNEGGSKSPSIRMGDDRKRSPPIAGPSNAGPSQAQESYGLTRVAGTTGITCRYLHRYLFPTGSLGKGTLPAGGR